MAGGKSRNCAVECERNTAPSQSAIGKNLGARIGKDPATLRERPEYAKRNNIQAVEFVRQSPAGDDHVYVLTTSSWRELGKIKELKKKGQMQPSQRHARPNRKGQAVLTVSLQCQVFR